MSTTDDLHALILAALVGNDQLARIRRQEKKLAEELGRTMTMLGHILGELAPGEPERIVQLPTGGGVKLTRTQVPTVVDAAKFRAHILATGELDLLQNRPSITAIRARWEQGDIVPGASNVQVQELKLIPPQ